MASASHKVRFLPEGVWVQVAEGESLKDVAHNVGIEIMSTCGGQGTCEKCGVRILAGKARIAAECQTPALKSRGYVLSCQTYPEDDMTVEVPVESRLAEACELLQHEEIVVPGLEVGLERYPLYPLACKFEVAVDKPTLTENLSDLTRLTTAVRKTLGAQTRVEVGLQLLRSLPSILRVPDGKVMVTLVRAKGICEIIRVESGGENIPCLGLAIDVGTTTVTVYLVDMTNGRTPQRLATYNEQFVYGEDVITRIIHASRSPENLAQLQQAALRTVNGLIDQALNSEGVTVEDISCAVVAGNTTMSHLFLGIDPKYIRLEPYIPAAVQFPPIKAREVGLRMNPEGYVFTLPCVGSYVGGDVVAGTLVAGFAEDASIRMLADLGTNGEVVLGNEEFMVASACSIGPAFEGGGITCGMRSVPGAVHRVRVNNGEDNLSVETVGGKKPIGLCGSGLVEILAALVNTGILDRSGNFVPHAPGARLREHEGDVEFVLLSSEETGIGRDLTITYSDVKNLIRAKAALFSGMRHLIHSVGMTMDAVERMYVAGAFGSHLDLRSAIAIGMLADVPEDRYVVLGNSSVKGARLCLLSQEALQTAERLASRMTYLELSVDPTYMEEFMAANFLPHTDLSLFPSVTVL